MDIDSKMQQNKTHTHCETVAFSLYLVFIPSDFCQFQICVNNSRNMRKTCTNNGSNESFVCEINKIAYVYDIVKHAVAHF